MHKLTLRITGIHGADQFDEIQKLVGFLYLKGTDPGLYVDLPREQADLASAQINATPGLHAEVVKWI